MLLFDDNYVTYSFKKKRLMHLPKTEQKVIDVLINVWHNRFSGK